MSVLKPGSACIASPGISACWRALDDSGPDAPLGVAQVGADQIGASHGGLCFTISRGATAGPDIAGCEALMMPAQTQPWALRVDEVAFPVGAVAHRHTHTGSGWRHLVSGALRIETDHDAQIMEAGMSWFEPAGSPVRAVALQTSGVTRFVRAMVIPQSFVGRSTFQLCDAKDAGLARLQMTHRHFDHVFQLDAG